MKTIVYVDSGRYFLVPVNNAVARAAQTTLESERVECQVATFLGENDSVKVLQEAGIEVPPDAARAFDRKAGTFRSLQEHDYKGRDPRLPKQLGESVISWSKK